MGVAVNYCAYKTNLNQKEVFLNKSLSNSLYDIDPYMQQN